MFCVCICVYFYFYRFFFLGSFVSRIFSCSSVAIHFPVKSDNMVVIFYFWYLSFLFMIFDLRTFQFFEIFGSYRPSNFVVLVDAMAVLIPMIKSAGCVTPVKKISYNYFFISLMLFFKLWRNRICLPDHKL